MNKRRVWIIILFLVAGSAVFIYFKISNEIIVGEFCIETYRWEIENFPSDKNVGQVKNKEVAIQKAKQLWIDEFSTFNNQSYNPVNGKEIEISYDAQNECWFINGTLPSNTKGSVPCAIIDKDGNVLAVWMG